MASKTYLQIGLVDVENIHSEPHTLHYVEPK